MKSLLNYGLAILVMAAVSCTKEDDQPQTATSTSSPTIQRVTYSVHVAPLVRKTCSASNCHNGISESNISSGSLVESVYNGTFEQRIFVLGNTTPCGSIDKQSLSMLHDWVNQGAQVE
ncbi:MAG: hypothetical protein ABI772_00430 [Bacteroidota bacterium]